MLKGNPHVLLEDRKRQYVTIYKLGCHFLKPSKTDINPYGYYNFSSLPTAFVLQQDITRTRSVEKESFLKPPQELDRLSSATSVTSEQSRNEQVKNVKQTIILVEIICRRI